MMMLMMKIWRHKTIMNFKHKTCNLQFVKLLNFQKWKFRKKRISMSTPCQIGLFPVWEIIFTRRRRFYSPYNCHIHNKIYKGKYSDLKIFSGSLYPTHLKIPIVLLTFRFIKFIISDQSRELLIINPINLHVSIISTLSSITSYCCAETSGNVQIMWIEKCVFSPYLFLSY